MLALSRLAIVLDTEEDKDNLKILQDAIPQMVAVLKQAVDEGDEDRTTQSFEVRPPRSRLLSSRSRCSYEFLGLSNAFGV